MLHAGSLHASQLPLSGNQQAFRIVEEQLVINILGWPVGRYHRTRGTGGSTRRLFLPLSPVCVGSHVSIFSASVSLLFISLLYSHLSAPDSCLFPSLLDSSCLSGFHCHVFVHFLFLLLVSACLSLSECSDLGFSSSPFRSLPL